MPKYKLSGTIEYLIEVRVVDRIIEAEDEESAKEMIIDEEAPIGYDQRWGDDTLKVIELEEGEIPEDQRLRMLGAAMLPGF